MLDDSGSIEENGLHADKLDLKEKRRLIEGTENIDIANSDVYVIDREIDNNVSEKTVVVKAANKGNGYISHTKEGRVTITCVLGYEKRTIANVPTTRGTYFGGKVNSVQSMVQVTGLTGVYHDAGAYFLANGSSGFSPDYRKTKSFDVAKMKTLQKQTARVFRNIHCLASILWI
ncbi:MAG: hypothetical protein IKE52_01320 [Mogibacterium sp.]|nr:hypothetical protein [Mogibacterium sp.]